MTNCWKHLHPLQIEEITERVYEELTHGDPDKRWKVDPVKAAILIFNKCQEIDTKLAELKK